MKYRDVAAYLMEREPWQRQRMQHARSLILSASPGIVECVKYNTPFYTYKGLLFYLSTYRRKEAVMGFCNGFLMSDPERVLRADAGQTQIRHWALERDSAIDEDLLSRYIQEALLVNDHLQAQRTKKGKR